MDRDRTDIPADPRCAAEAGRCGVRGLVVVMAVLLAGPLAVPAMAGELRSPVVPFSDQSGVRRLSESVVLVLRGLQPEQADRPAWCGLCGAVWSETGGGLACAADGGHGGLAGHLACRLDLLDLPPPLVG